MYINLDVLMRIAQIILVAAGCAALFWLAVVFKNLVETLKSATKTLDALQKDLEKLESPLETVDAISNTVDELHQSTKKAAESAITTFTAGMDTLKNKFDKSAPSAPETLKTEDSQPPKEVSQAEFVPAADLQIQETEIIEEAADKQPQKAESESAVKEGD